MSFVPRLSMWGIASAVLFVLTWVVMKYNLYLYDQNRPMMFSFGTGHRLCLVMFLAAVVCGVVAMRRQSGWWAVTVVPSAAYAVLACFLGDL